MGREIRSCPGSGRLLGAPGSRTRRGWVIRLQVGDQRLYVPVEVVPVVPGEPALLVGPYHLLEADLVAAVAGDRHPGKQVVGGRPVDDDRVVAGDEVADALAVGEPFGLVVDPKGQVVEQAVGDLGRQAGGDQFRALARGMSFGTQLSMILRMSGLILTASLPITLRSPIWDRTPLIGRS